MVPSAEHRELAGAEIQSLVDFGTDVARSMYAKHDPWIPFAFALASGQRISMCAFMPSDLDDATTQEILAFARTALAAMSDPDLRAVALVYEGLTRNPDGSVRSPDAVMVEVDHCVAGAFTIATPFMRKRSWPLKRTMILSDDVTVTPGSPIRFAHSAGHES